MAKILVVDDRASNREYFTTLLEYGGHQLLEATDGSEALRVVENELPDLVIADILMPTMDGFEFVRQLRTTPTISSTPVIFCTAQFHKRDARALARSCGVQHVLTKPAEPEHILKAVDQVLRAGRSAPDVPETFDREHLRLVTDRLSERTDELKRSNDRLSALLDLSLQLGSELDLKRLIRSLGDAARKIVGARYAVTAVIDAEARQVHQIFSSGMNPEMAASVGLPDPDSAVLRAVMTESKCLRGVARPDEPVQLGFAKIAALPRVHSWLVAPIASPTRTFGYIGVIDKIGWNQLEDGRTWGEFDPEDERLISVLAAQVGRIYQTGSLYADAVRHAADLEREIAARERTERNLAERIRLISMLAEISAAVRKKAGLSEMLQQCCEVIVRHSGVIAARVWLAGPDSNVLAIAATAENPGTGRGFHLEKRVGDSFVESIVTSRVPGKTSAGTHESGQPVTLSGLPIESGGTIVGVLGLFHAGAIAGNVPDALPAVAQQLAVGIEIRLKEAAAEKLQMQLLQAQKMESVGRLAGGIAHDFNNLLTVVNGYSDVLIKEVPKGSSLAKSVQEIRKAGGRAAALSGQLLVVSRKQVIEKTHVNLNQVVGEVAQMLSSVIGEDIQIQLNLDPDLGNTLADAGQVHQVLMNLAVNARDAMPRGGKLLIETANSELDDSFAERHPDVRPGSYVQLRVTDDGTGMTPEVLTHLFEPFFTTKDPKQGTGLGLAIVYGIVKQSGGSISVYSEPGHGTTFVVYLPRIEGRVDDRSAPAAVPSTLRGDETILIVEDQEQVRELAALILAGYGYNVIQAANPEEAILRVKEYPQRIHLLLTDVIMPGMTGCELADHLESLRPEMKVLYMSGYSERAITEKGLLAGAGAYIPKPFSAEALALKVRSAIGAPAGKACILVVDDDPAVRSFIRKVLSDAGHEVHEAQNGSAAIETVSKMPVQMIITDLAMPEKEGIETIRELTGTHPGLKIIAMSGQFENAVLDAAGHLGARATLPKPFTPGTLLETVARVLSS